MLLKFKTKAPLMRYGASVVWHLSLPLMNSFKKPSLLFSHAGYASFSSGILNEHQEAFNFNNKNHC